ncbi:RNA methyltransferase [Mycetocola sp. JXN-3]|uniref:TrmH family RNA methyltransferase n=1 Tax=Mycetocola sp. JXN-3 TaxID=2116510 RepID=UPI00165D01A2|nr:RNA methyltransferase [Mycetocola sp. JXN-3]
MLDNPRAPRIRAVARLGRRAVREETGLFLLEGPQAVVEALTYRPEVMLELYVTPTALERYTDLGEAAVAAGMDVEFVSEEVINAMADTVTPQGVIAVARQFPTSAKDIFRDEPKLIAILEEVRDPGNLGTIIRAADAAGADGVILTGRSVDLYNPKVVRSTTGSLFHLPVAVGLELPDVLLLAREAGVSVIAADIKGDSLLEVRNSGVLAEPTAWLFGNEARGLTDENLARAERAVSVPIFGAAESMNLATAASVCLYESAFAQRS